MDDTALLRYSRHILLDEVGIEGQEAFQQAHALIVGAGGLGCPAAMYLAAAGVGHITLVDHDTVDLTNLQRQIGHTTERVGTPKVESLATTLRALNPLVRIDTICAKADAALLDTLLPSVQVVLDCCDNYRTRHTVNAACVQHKVPLVSGAAIRLDGQVTVFDPRHNGSACYACLFAPNEAFEEVQCATMGVLAPMVGIIGATQAMEALKILGDVGTPLTGRLLLLDGKNMEWTRMHTAANPECPVCSAAK